MALESPLSEQKESHSNDFSIVPLKGLYGVVVILIVLIVTIEKNWLYGLEFFHVVSGGLWTAIDLFVGFVIGPILGKLSVPARIEFSKRFMPKMLLIMPTLVACTLSAGWQLARHLGNLSHSSPNHTPLVISFIVVGVMTLIALGILEPANIAVLLELKRFEPRGEVIGKLMKRFIYTAGITGAMQIATLIIMTWVTVK